MAPTRFQFVFVLVVTGAASALAEPIVVHPLDLATWQEQNSTCHVLNTGSTGFQTGPATPPLGEGSARFTVGTVGNSFNTFRYPGVDGVLLSDLTALSYSTYVQRDGISDQAPYLLLDIDTTGDSSADDQLRFDPAFQTGAYPGDPVPDQGMVTIGLWQGWDALAGGWWSQNAHTFGPPLVTLSTYVAQNPTARIVNTASGLGGFRVASGCAGLAWEDFVGNFDAVEIGAGGTTTIFDFELAAPEADLSIVKSGPASPSAGAEVVFTIVVTNHGPQAASQVVVTDPMPRATTLVAATPSQGSCSGTTTVTCHLGAVAAGDDATIQLVVQAGSPGTVSNTATVANGAGVDPDPDDDTSTATAGVGVLPVPTLSQWGLAALVLALAGLGVARLR